MALCDRAVILDGVGAWVPINWRSGRLQRAVTSTFSGETQCYFQGLCEMEWLMTTLIEVRDGAQDLTKPPFSLPPPLALFNERYPVDGRVALGLWSVRSLRHRLL